MEPLNQKINVIARFNSAGTVYPIYIELSGNLIKLKKPDAIWKERVGRNLITRFSSSDGANRYILAFNHETLEWKLEVIIDE
uniref:Uncharacterized protein n=1 Tax=candidate division WOR-3 bacterium TaxID=2052148 RepID=A0A7C2K413_UNCW3